MTQISANQNGHLRLNDSAQHMTHAADAPQGDAPTRYVRIVILGTGFSGLGMAIQLKKHGYNDFVIIEKASDVGGTWRDNTYPGCACDIPSHLYSFSFAPNPYWSHTYSPQHEIRSYLRHCTERFGLLSHIQWNSALQEATWHEDEQRWYITTTQGRLSTNLLILGNGPLSEPSLPSISGIESFKGTLFHSARWRHDYDLTNKRVAVIGTGASAIQFVPQIQPHVGHLTLFQRTPPWILPRQDQAIASWQHTLFRFLPMVQRLIRTRMYWQRELLVLGFRSHGDLLGRAEQLALGHLRRQISDPDLRAKLIPQYRLGCKRILLSNDYYPALTQTNVELVTERIRAVRAHSILAENGQEHEIDTIICGTGFHVTDTQLPQYVYGRTSQSLADTWQTGPSAYLGTSVAGFPNLFLLIGPNTGLGHNSMVYMIEAQTAYILDCLHIMDRYKLQTVEIQAEAQEAYNVLLQQQMQCTVWASGCASWYLAANGRNTTLWPTFTFKFRHQTRRFDLQHYRAMAASARSATV